MYTGMIHRNCCCVAASTHYKHGGVVMAVAWLQEWLQMDGQGWYCIQSAALRAEHRKGKKRPAVACSTAAVAAAGSF